MSPAVWGFLGPHAARALLDAGESCVLTARQNLAASAFAGDEPIAYLRRSLETLFSVLEAARRWQVGRVCLASTIGVYAELAERRNRMTDKPGRGEIAKQSYLAFARAERQFFEDRLSDDFTFSSPPDPHLDRDGWFERCWPGAGRGQEFRFTRVVEAGDEVIVSYELRHADGSAGYNTEILTFDDDNKIARTEVYFGWNV